MESLNEYEYKLIRQYKRKRKDDIALYFYDKFSKDVVSIVYSKLRLKFSSMPFEKGDLAHIVWKCVKKCLREFKVRKNISFNSLLVQTTYFNSIKEIRKFLNNKNLVMEQAYSLENDTHGWCYRGKSNLVIQHNSNRDIALQNLISNACDFVKNYSPSFIKRVIYLKSLGYSMNNISQKLNVSITDVFELLKSIEKMVDEYY